MSEAPKHVQFFGDAERTFCLTPELILELERKTNVGIGAIFNRLLSRNFALADIQETIRLGLVGGGESPEVAASLVAAYVGNRPLSETYPLAVSIFETVWFGAAQEREA